MLRVKGPTGPPEAPPQEEAAPPAPPPQAMPQEAPMEPAPTGAKVMPAIAVYMTPDLGPFMCGNCLHYDGQGGCAIVDGPIDPEGMCHIFTPGGESAPDEEAPAEPMPEEPPMEALPAGPPVA